MYTNEDPGDLEEFEHAMRETEKRHEVWAHWKSEGRNESV